MSPQESVLSLSPPLFADSLTPGNVLSDASAALISSGLAPSALDSPSVSLSTAENDITASNPVLPNAVDTSVFGQAYLLGNSDVEKPTVVQAYLVDSDKLALRVETSDIVFGKQVPYEAQPQDEIFSNGPLDTWVSRDGEELGFLGGKDRNILRTFDDFVGETLDVGWADNRLNYTLRSTEDPNFFTGVNPEAIFRKTKPIDMGNTAVFSTVYSLSHTLYLDLPLEIIPGQSYTIDFAGDELEDLTFTFDPVSSITEAVHVTQVGFRPDDPIKQGYLSTWMGSGGAIAYDPNLKFQLVDDATSTVAYSGTIELDKSVNSPETTSNKSFALTDIYKLDFSDFTQPGKYRLAVEGIGTSLPFEINNSTWSNAFSTAAQGFYYQRSGIALEKPYADRDRPRAFHPDDGVKVYQSKASLMELQLNEDFSLDDIFSNLIAQSTEEVLPDAWGGYYDAGDWDRRIDHLVASRSFIELAELYPDFYKGYDLNLPESTNDLPDIIDEALWGIDFFKRLQKADGGVPGGIESAEHPKTGETSWQESLKVYAFAPDMWSSFLYAGTAAQAAHWLKSNGFTAKGQEYLDSALRAMAFGERELAAVGGKSPFTEVGDARNLAALSLFRATGNQAWNQLFLDTTSFVNDGAQLFAFNRYDQREAAFLYSRIDFAGQDKRIKGNAVEAILTEASEAMNFSDGNSFNWTQENGFAAAVWDGGLGSTNVQKILRAHWLTDNSLFLKYGILGTQVAMGANPENMTYTTGLGLRNPENPLIINDRVLGEKPVPGITLYGPNNLDALGNFFILDQTADFTFPNIYDWPTLESYLDLYLFVPGSEFTLHQTMVPTTYALGYLAARQNVGQDVGGIETVQSFLKGQKVDLNPKDGLNNPIQRLLVDDDSYQLRPNQSLVVNAAQGLLNGDSFDPRKPISIIVKDIPSSGGGIFLNKDGSFRYQPAKGFEGTETLTYQISNGVEQSSLATVSFKVGAAATLPPVITVDGTPRSIRAPLAAPGTDTTPPVAPPGPATPTNPAPVPQPELPTPVTVPSPTPTTPTPVTPTTPGIVIPPPSPTPGTPVFTPSAVPVAIAPPLNDAFGRTSTRPPAISTAVTPAISLPAALPVALPATFAPTLPTTPTASTTTATEASPSSVANTSQAAKSQPSKGTETPKTGLTTSPSNAPEKTANTVAKPLFLGEQLGEELPDIAQGDFEILQPGEFDLFFFPKKTPRLS